MKGITFDRESEGADGIVETSQLPIRKKWEKKRQFIYFISFYLFIYKEKRDNVK